MSRCFPEQSHSLSLSPPLKEMTESLLDYGDFNVLTVDWGGGSDVLYSQAAANTRLVALEVAAVLEAIVVR